ncbi:MAG: XamI family restriction endonuclease [Candidatus Bathyarchaeia archaeon]
MPVNSDKPSRWKVDISRSVDFYNDWFMKFAPKAYRDTRSESTKQVQEALDRSSNLTNVTSGALRESSQILEMLRMATAPPIARDRLIGLAGVPKGLVMSMEVHGRIPPHMTDEVVETQLQKISSLIMKLADKDIFSWLENGTTPDENDVHRAATIVADRLCGAQSDPIIRNAQEKRQLDSLKKWLEQRSYSYSEPGKVNFKEMKPGTFTFHLGISVTLTGGKKQVNIPVDVAVMPRQAKAGNLPLLIEAKSAGDFTNPNKRRKEEAVKISQLQATYGKRVRYILFLCGYFDSGYLGYEAAEGIDWVWEHRIDDLPEFGV